MQIIPNSTGEYFVTLVPDGNTINQNTKNLLDAVSLDPWWNVSFDFERAIQLNSTANAPLVDFPALVVVDTASLIVQKHMLSNCADVRFINSAKTGLLSYELENNTCNSGATVFWVKTNLTAKNTNTTIYMDYGNLTSVGPGNNTADVWSNGYVSVYHMEENNSMVDSLGNNNLQTTNPSCYVPIVENTTAKFGNALSSSTANFLPCNYTKESPTGMPTGTSPFSISGWVSPNAGATSYTALISYGNMGTNNAYALYARDSDINRLSFGVYGTGPTAFTPTVGLGGWNYWYITKDAAGNTNASYNTTTPTSFSKTYSLTSGRLWVWAANRSFTTSTNYLNGTMDEIRFASVQRDASWFQAEYGQTYYAGAESFQNTTTITAYDQDSGNQLNFTAVITNSTTSQNILYTSNYTNDSRLIPTGTVTFTITNTTYFPWSLTTINAPQNLTVTAGLLNLTSQYAHLVTFYVVDASQQKVQNALVNVFRTTNGIVQTAGGGYTDSAGTFAVYMSSNAQYTITASANIGSYSGTVTPTQSTYMIVLGGNQNYSLAETRYTNIQLGFSPLTPVLSNETVTISASFTDLINNNTIIWYALDVYNGTTLLNHQNVTGDGGVLTYVLVPGPNASLSAVQSFLRYNQSLQSGDSITYFIPVLNAIQSLGQTAAQVLTQAGQTFHPLTITIVTLLVAVGLAGLVNTVSEGGAVIAFCCIIGLGFFVGAGVFASVGALVTVALFMGGYYLGFRGAGGY